MLLAEAISMTAFGLVGFVKQYQSSHMLPLARYIRFEFASVAIILSFAEQWTTAWDYFGSWDQRES